MKAGIDSNYNKKADCTIADLQHLEVHKHPHATAECIASVVKHETHRTGVAGFPGLLAIHFVEESVHKEAPSIHKT
jgi:hypothetical protein